MNLFYPDLWDRLFTPGYVSAEEVEAARQEVFHPVTEEDFKSLLEEIEREESLKGTFTQQL